MTSLWPEITTNLRRNCEVRRSDVAGYVKLRRNYVDTTYPRWPHFHLERLVEIGRSDVPSTNGWNIPVVDSNPPWRAEREDASNRERISLVMFDKVFNENGIVIKIDILAIHHLLSTIWLWLLPFKFPKQQRWPTTRASCSHFWWLPFLLKIEFSHI